MDARGECRERRRWVGSWPSPHRPRAGASHEPPRRCESEGTCESRFLILRAPVPDMSLLTWPSL
eukprot:6762458-Alexandrium_andersonii.AAC.1